MSTESPLDGIADQSQNQTINTLTATEFNSTKTKITTQTKVSTNKSGVRKSRRLEVVPKLNYKMKSPRMSHNKSQVGIAEFVVTLHQVRFLPV
jgi:hypothetical protein